MELSGELATTMAKFLVGVKYCTVQDLNELPKASARYQPLLHAGNTETPLPTGRLQRFLAARALYGQTVVANDDHMRILHCELSLMPNADADAGADADADADE